MIDPMTNAPTPARNLSPAHPMNRRVDTSNLTPTMIRTLNRLDDYWQTADEEGYPEGAWVMQGRHGVTEGTYIALLKRGFDVQRRRTYFGYEYRAPDPHPAGLTGLGWW